MRRLRAALHAHRNERHIQREAHTAIIAGVFFFYAEYCGLQARLSPFVSTAGVTLLAVVLCLIYY